MISQLAKDISLPELPASFLGKTGRFYVRQHLADGEGFSNRLTVWSSPEAYNKRNQMGLCFCDEAETLADFDHSLKVYSESLTTTPPPCERDTDETDYGLTPAQQLWVARFARVKAVKRYAA